MDRTTSFRGEGGKDCNRRILVIAGPSGEGPLTEPTAAVRLRRRKPLTLRADGRHHARIGILGGEQLVHHAQPRAARAFLVEEPEVAVGPLALAGCGDRIGRIVAGDHVEDRYGVGSRALERGCAPGGRPQRLSVAIARRFRLTHFEPFVPPSAAFLKKHNCLLPWAVSVIIRAISRVAL